MLAPTIEAVNRKLGCVLLSTGETVKIERFLDRYGDDTEDLDLAVVAIAPLPSGLWIVIDLRYFDSQTVH